MAGARLGVGGEGRGQAIARATEIAREGGYEGWRLRLHRQPHAHHARRVVGAQLVERAGAHDVGVANGLDLVDVVLLAQPVELLEDVRQDTQHLGARACGCMAGVRAAAWLVCARLQAGRVWLTFCGG